MFDLVRLIYTSRAQFEFSTDMNGGSDIEPELAHILQQSRFNNRQANIGGVLYFAEGYFFQCVEGRKSQVLNLVDRLQQDQRHNDFKISYFRRARRRRFREWSMKYVPVGEDVRRLICARGYDRFDPCSFDESDINSVIDLFTKLEDTTLAKPELRTACRLKQKVWKRLFTNATLRVF